MAGLIEERENGTYYTGPIAPARAYLRRTYDVRERYLTEGAVQVGEWYAPSDTDPSTWGTSAEGDWDEAWRYFAGADFGPLDDEYDDAALRAILAQYGELGGE